MTKKIKQEQGRSMVEMLGVLAIIGVLSVGGIAGYKSAITKHRANETIDRLLKRAVVIAGQVGLGQQADISGFNQDDGTYTISLTPPETGATSFVLNVAAVPEEVCQKIKDMWTLPTIIPSDSCSGTNNMTFTFANDLSEAGNGGNGGNTPAPCPSGEQNSNGTCSDGSCTDNSNCLSESFCNSGTGMCVELDDVSLDVSTASAIVSNDLDTFEATKNFCERKGMSLLSASSLYLEYGSGRVWCYSSDLFAEFKESGATSGASAVYNLRFGNDDTDSSSDDVLGATTGDASSEPDWYCAVTDRELSENSFAKGVCVK